MKMLNIIAPALFFGVVLTGCNGASETKETPNSELNDIDKQGVEESRAAIGVGEGNQDEAGGYPKNQANLYLDSTRKDSIKRAQ